MSNKPNKLLAVLGSGHFLLSAVILLAMAVGVNAVLARSGFVLAKAAVPLVKTLEEFPETVGYRYELAREINEEGIFQGKAQLTADTVKTLGTEDFITWFFRDKLRSTDDSPVYVRLHLAYYTKLLEAVPHVPERCQLAGGSMIDAKNTKDLTWTLSDAPAGWDQWDTVGVRQAGFIRQDRQGKDHRSVVFYLFCANGESAGRQKVILMMSTPWKKYCYFMKIELSALAIGRTLSAAEAEQLCRDFFVAASDSIFEHVASAAEIKNMEAGR